MYVNKQSRLAPAYLDWMTISVQFLYSVVYSQKRVGTAMYPQFCLKFLPRSPQMPTYTV